MQAGLIGLGVMGRNLALNLRDSGHDVIATDAWESARAWSAPGIIIAQDHLDMLQQLDGPRVIILMVKAGEQVDTEIKDLAAHLSPGDIIIDGGNSNYVDTERRAADLAARDIGYLGVGISGGAEGARHGASIMAGGKEADWHKAKDLLTSIAATINTDDLAIDWFGDGGAGHFVKMIHNGIEYAIMQAIAECHGLMRDCAGLSADEISTLLARWSTDSPAAGYLLEISAEIACARDAATGELLLPLIDDAAGQKGTGGWTMQAALAHGVPAPAIAEALHARQVSGQQQTRLIMQDAVTQQTAPGVDTTFIADLEAALTATMIVSLAQGLQIYAAAAREHGWREDLPAVLRVWRAGSILRMRMLDGMADRLQPDAEALNFLTVPEIADQLVALLPAWRRVAVAALSAGFPAPVLTASLTYIDALATSPLPTAFIQAQRDRFGAHGFGRTDRDGQHHGPWLHPDQEAGS